MKVFLSSIIYLYDLCYFTFQQTKNNNEPDIHSNLLQVKKPKINIQSTNQNRQTATKEIERERQLQKRQRDREREKQNRTDNKQNRQSTSKAPKIHFLWIYLRSLSINRTDSYKRDRERETWKRINHEPTVADGYKLRTLRDDRFCQF